MISTINKWTKSLLTFNHFFRHFCPQIRCNSMNTNSDTDGQDEDYHYADREFKDMTVDTFASLVTSETTRQSIQTILSEYEYEKYVTLDVPTSLTTDHMRDLMALESAEDRKNWFRYLLRKELSLEVRQRRRADNSREFWAKKREMYAECRSPRTGIWDDDQQLLYGLWHNCIVSKVEPKSIKRLFAHRLRRAALFGHKVVIDLGFDDHLKLKDCRSLAAQIQVLYNHNKYRCDEPFDIHFANCDPRRPTMQSIAKNVVNYKSPYFVSTFHEKSYLDVFPSERLVYLSPHSQQILQKFNADHIYIIGGCVGPTSGADLTNTKAKREGIRSARLPIDDHILWRTGSRSLSLDVMVSILHDLSVGHSMADSLRKNIPERNQKSIEDIELEDKRRLEKYHKRRQFKSDLKAINR